MHKIIPNTFTFISDFKKAQILNLYKNTGIILRNFENEYPIDKIIKLRDFCRSSNKKLYLANDIRLAIKLNLDGAYISAFNKNINIYHSVKKNFTILGSAHDQVEIKIKEKQGVDIIFISPLFKTKNYKKWLGITKFNMLSKSTKKKVVALGGINQKNIKKLKMTNAYGFSGISYFLK